ncbi:MAG: RNA polymerase sigma factor [Candidatus Krumholzibacteriales bacterium]
MKLIRDADLMEKAAGGDSGAFRIIVEKYKQPMYNFFLRSTGSREDAEDLLQNLFMALFRSARRYKKTASFRTYIYRIASNMLVSYYRKSRDVVSIDEGGDQSDGFKFPDTSPEANPLKRAELSQLEEGFGKALAGLPAETAAALELRVRSGFSYKEIAEIMDKSVSAVESMIFRGRRTLADRMSHFREGADEEKS